jgi:hypothetical protein
MPAKPEIVDLCLFRLCRQISREKEKVTARVLVSHAYFELVGPTSKLRVRFAITPDLQRLAGRVEVSLPHVQFSWQGATAGRELLQPLGRLMGKNYGMYPITSKGYYINYPEFEEIEKGERETAWRSLVLRDSKDNGILVFRSPEFQERRISWLQSTVRPLAPELADEEEVRQADIEEILRVQHLQSTTK